MATSSVYARLGVRPFINACGTITTLGGSIMPPRVVEAMVEASRCFVHLNEFQEKAGARIAQLTGAEAAYVCAGAASGMLLAGAACLTGTDTERIQRLPEVGERPREFVISLVDSHYYVHQGLELCGGRLVKVGTPQQVSPADYAAGLSERSAAAVFFLGMQPKDELPEIIRLAHARKVPVIVDAAAQLPPRANLTDLPAMGVDLAVFSGGKGLFGPQSTGLILGRRDLVQACALNSNPYSAIGRGMKVGKEEIAGLLAAVELFFEQDETALIAEWERRCRHIGESVARVPGITVSYTRPFENRFPPASPLVHLGFAPEAPQRAPDVVKALREGEPSILVSGSQTSLTVGPQTLQDGEAEVIAARLAGILCRG
ncbi:MAG: aminotransferase class V-fold PLP-dependent enzyme [Candidatus Latescibacterota bacterium]|jgi:L-seryl-tRNA(Ser) seleniumtransferase